MKNEYSLLNKIAKLGDLKKLKQTELPELAEEIRQFIIENVSKTGGHLGASLGVVELTVALHYSLNSPKDKIIWDVGHQCYAHKILTGRRDRFHTLRQYKGISGFPKISESEHDAFGAGHASTSISAALGIAKARDLQNKDFEVIAVIGDGAMTGGNALEAINQAGYLNTKIIVILNDNRMSISKNVGALSKYAHRIESTDIYKRLKKTLGDLIEQGDGLKDKLIALKEHIKEVGSPGLLFEKLGFNYIGSVDGHNVNAILVALENALNSQGASLIHLRTTKGKGYIHAEENKSKFHGVNPFDIESGKHLNRNRVLSYTEIFAKSLIEIAESDPGIVGITASMPEGTGLNLFKERFPDRFFDVGIAEQHAVVFAAGMAKQGLKPVCAIYSSFLQRAYDAIIHDVCLQEIPVIFAIDRAGLVGNDGPTHHGCFDISYLRCIPNIVVMAPKDASEMRDMLFTATQICKPVAIRYPRGSIKNFEEISAKQLDVGKSEFVKNGEDLTIVSIGIVFSEALKAWETLSREGIQTSLINARFVKPLDEEIAASIQKSGKAIIIEENSIKGGFGSSVVELCQDKNIKADIRLIAIPDKFIEQGNQNQLRKDCGLTCDNIIVVARELLG